MKRQLLLFAFVLLCSTLYAQDLVVTTGNDSMNCQILTIGDKPVGDKLIHFIVMRDNEEIKVSLPMEQVLSFSLGYYSDAKEERIYQWDDNHYARFRVALAGGYSYRTFTIPDGTSSDSRNYQNESRKGFHYGVEFNYYFHRFLGIGINYYADHFNPTGKIPDLYYIDPIDGYAHSLSCKARIQQITPTFNVRVLDRQRRGALVAGIGIGYADYKTKYYQTDYDNRHVLTEKGWTVGVLWSIGYDIPLSQTMAIYVRASLNAGVVNNFTLIDEITRYTEHVTTDDVNEGVGLGRMNLSIGVRFAK